MELDPRPLLSGQASRALGLIDRTNDVTYVRGAIENFPQLKDPRASLSGVCSLETDTAVQPVVHGTRRQPQAVSKKIKDKLQQMKDEDQIMKVAVSSDWVSSLSVVCKKGLSLNVHGPQKFEQSIKKEHYSLPTMEGVVALFPEVKVFSVLAANSGFIQIKLDYESSTLVTFNSPQGHYRWLRLPLGIESASKIFWSKMEYVLPGTS